MRVSSLSSWLHRWLNAAKMMICKLCLIVSALTVGWSVMGIFGEQSGFVLPASAETPAERCAKRGMVLVGRSCETPKKKAESPAERCAKRGMILVGRSCETPKKKKAETSQQRCAKQNKKC